MATPPDPESEPGGTAPAGSADDAEDARQIAEGDVPSPNGADNADDPKVDNDSNADDGDPDDGAPEDDDDPSDDNDADDGDPDDDDADNDDDDDDDNDDPDDDDHRTAPNEPTLRQPRDADGRERPHFLLNYPRDPALEPLIDAFLRGDYLMIRQSAEQVARATTDDAVRDAALELRRRIDPDPMVVRLLWLSVAALVGVVAWTYWGAH